MEYYVTTTILVKTITWKMCMIYLKDSVFHRLGNDVSPPYCYNVYEKIKIQKKGNKFLP